MNEPTSSEPGWGAKAVVAGVLFVLAALILYDTTLMRSAQAVGVGPTPAMRLVAILLALLGVGHVVSALRSRAAQRGSKAASADAVFTNRAALAWVMSGLVGMIVVLQIGGGFVIGSTWLFAATARGFGQPIRMKSAAIGFTLSALVYAFFTLGLSLTLPAGPLERLFLG